MGLVFFHLFKYLATFLVLLGQFAQMVVEMFNNLVFGFGDKAEAPFVAKDTCKRANSK